MNLIPRKDFFDDFWDEFVPMKADNMKCDIYEKGGNYFIEMDIPGFDKNDIAIDVNNDYLTISASKDETKEDKDKNYIRKERSFGKYERSFYVGNIDSNEIKAEFKHGLLKVSIPKEKKIENNKKIQID